MQDQQQQQPKKQTKEQNKRPLSNSSCSSVSIPTKRKINIDEQEVAFLFDPKIDASSCPEITDFKLFAEDCCHKPIQKCTGRYFACACEKQYYKCQCGGKLLVSEKRAYRCDECNEM